MTDNQQTPVEQMHDLSIEINNGLWRLQQSDGMGEHSIIDLHPVQIRLLAEHAGLLVAPPKRLNKLSTSHIRRLNALHERIEELYFNDRLTSEIMKCCGDGFEVMNHLRAIHEQAGELAADIEDSEPIQKSAEVKSFDGEKDASHDTKQEQRTDKAC
tara:strand:+ start:169 stop:639 length:471 start_codon:yes stop_codon:yes gene_type:complete